MARSMVDYLQSDMECEGLLECLHGLKALDRECFQVIVAGGGPMTVDEIADRVDRERSTVYRAVTRLQSTGLVEKDQVNYDQGGYFHVYEAVDADEVAADMQRLLNDWYAKLGQLISEFEDKYRDPPAVAAGE